MKKSGGRIRELSVRVVKHNGAMSLEIDGSVQPFTSFKICETPDTAEMLEAARAEIPGIARQGIALCWVPIFIHWKGPGQYDFSDMDLRIRTVLDLYDQHLPQGQTPARIVVRVQAAVFMPEWYVKQGATPDGKTTNLLEFRNPWGLVDSLTVDQFEANKYPTAFAKYGSTLAISPGDPFWDTHAIDCINALVAHVRESDYAGRVFGWLPCAFNTNEWFIRTFAPDASCDFSPPTQRAFRDYLRGKGIECGEQPVPTPEECKTAGYGEFLKPDDPAGRRVEEFSLWLSNRFVDIITKMTGAIKAATADSPKLVGVFYGYSLGLSRLQNLSQSAQLGVNRLLKTDSIDFICSPCEYYHRADEKPFSASMVMGPFAHSAADCNKLVFMEDDHPPSECNISMAWLGTRDKWHDEMFFRRNFAQVLSHGQQTWWYSLWAKWYKDDYRQKIIGELNRLGLEAQERDRTPVAEVAVVIDERSVSTMRFNAPLHQMLLTDSFGAFFQTGAPFECFELNSFLHDTDVSRFKVVVFLNLFRTDPGILAAMDKLKAGGRTLMFSYAAGLLHDHQGKRTFSGEEAGKLVGMALEVEKKDTALTVWVDPDRVALMPGREDIRYGWTHMDVGVSPLVVGVVDEQAEPLGFLRSGTVGLARKQHPGWTSVYSSAPCVPAEVLRELLKQAGVHLYTEGGDVIYANRSMLACAAASRGHKVLKLPRRARLVDIFDGSTLELDEQNKVTLFMKRHEARVFWITDAS